VPPRRRLDHGHAAVAADADGQPRAVRRQGEVARPPPDGDPLDDGALLQIDEGDGAGGGEGDVGGLAAGGDGDAARLEAEADDAGGRQAVAVEVEEAQVAVPGGADEGAAADPAPSP
jgi:hypothetical protein